MSSALGNLLPFLSNKSKAAETTPGGQEPTRWAMVAENLQPIEAMMIKGRLESEDIPAVVRRESIGSVIGLTVGPLGWASVWVPEDMADKALDILYDYEDVEADDTTPTELDEEES